jgi:hypothetical protein
MPGAVHTRGCDAQEVLADTAAALTANRQIELIGLEACVCHLRGSFKTAQLDREEEKVAHSIMAWDTASR